MDVGLERERILEIVVSVIAVGLMFAVLYWIGSDYTTNQELSAEGGTMIVYSIVFFILVMAIAGGVLAFTISDGAES